MIKARDRVGKRESGCESGGQRGRRVVGCSVDVDDDDYAEGDYNE
jgi:hypothetical protein